MEPCHGLFFLKQSDIICLPSRSEFNSKFATPKNKKLGLEDDPFAEPCGAPKKGKELAVKLTSGG